MVAFIYRIYTRVLGEANLDFEMHDICAVSVVSDAVDRVVLPAGLEFCG